MQKCEYTMRISCTAIPVQRSLETVMPRSWSFSSTIFIVIGILAGAGFAQDPDLAGYFGFRPLEVVKIGRFAGPIACEDIDGDGLEDLIAVNNHASRIELHYQKRGASADDATLQPTRVNEFPAHWRFRREFISVTHAIAAIAPLDFDGDGLMDILYAGLPGQIVFVRQIEPGTFEVSRRHRVRALAANRDGLAVADVLGDERPELLSLVKGAISIWPLDKDNLGPAIELTAAEDMIGFVLEDFNGDGSLDIAGIIPDNPAPVRLWFGGDEDNLGVIGAEIRLEMPPLRECAAVRLPGRDAALMAVIERASKRIVMHEIAAEPIEETGDRDAAIRVHSFTDAGNRERDHAIVDADGDGLKDLIATDTEANAVVIYRQLPGKGFQAGESFPCLSDLTYLVAGDVDADEYAEFFVLSEKEGVVGRSDVASDGAPFPLPINVSAGHTPTALNLIQLEEGPHLAVVAKDGRDYVIDLIDMTGRTETIDLGKLSRSPETIIALDADQDGRTDLLLFTRDKPMTMLYAGDEGFVLTESKDMGQYGLVKAARSENIAIFDIDGDKKPELLIADKNFVRAVRYEPEPGPSISPGWQVVEQVNARDSSAKLVSLAILGDRIVAADKESDSLTIMERTGGPAPWWRQVESLIVRGFSFNSIHAGAFSGDGRENILAVGNDGFAVIRLAGERIALREVASWRSTEERRLQHELAYGDINNDGLTDMISLDAGEQMCEIFTFSEAGRLHYAMGFQVFESRMFSGGESHEYQPSQVLIADVTGDDADDLVLLSHDRILVYPQMMRSSGE